MNDPTRSAYAAILPDIKQLGYRCDLRAGLSASELFAMAVSGRPTVHIHRNGWERDDGPEGDDPTSLLDMMTRERLDLAEHHLAVGDWKGVAMDVLTLVRHEPPSAIVSASYRPGTDLLAVTVRPQRGMPETTTISHPEQQVRKAITHRRALLERKEPIV
ncbi:hypothetical protein COO72_02395 [Bifidobacterium callitrichos]|nr:hypothetical protein COO72_02395 [Bifidobacterium callitrichos]